MYSDELIKEYHEAPLEERLKDYAESRGIEICYFTNPNYEDAYIGLIEEDGITRVIYSFEKMLNYLTEKEGMSMTEAVEFIDYNIEGFKHANEDGEDDSPILAYDI